jgi:hypothetical protein
MAGDERAGTFRDASRIIEHSRVFEAADTIRRLATVSAGESRVVRAARKLAADFGELSSTERARYTLLTIGIAAASYVLIGSTLPKAIRPNIPLAAGVLILIVCGGVATKRRSRAMRSIRTSVLGVALLIALGSSGPAVGQTPPRSEKEDLLGVWEMVSAQDHRPNGETLSATGGEERF